MKPVNNNCLTNPFPCECDLNTVEGEGGRGEREGGREGGRGRGEREGGREGEEWKRVDEVSNSTIHTVVVDCRILFHSNNV